MLHLHNHYMKGTKLDGIVAVAILLFVIFVLAMLLGPVRVLSQERDEVRTTDVRSLMNSILQLELVDPEAYDRLVSDVKAAGDQRVVVGQGDCSVSHGSECSDVLTADVCLSLDDYFPSLLLSSLPVDPKGEPYSTAYTGYYLQSLDQQLVVGACDPHGDQIVLSTAF